MKPIGLRGELKLRISNDFWPQALGSKHLTVRTGDEEKSLSVLRARAYGATNYAVFLEAVEDRTAAEQSIGDEVWIDSENLDVEGPDSLRPFQVKGIEALLEDGTPLGTVEDLLRMPAQDVLVVKGLEKEHLIPWVDAFIEEFNLDRGILKIRPVPGLLEL